MNNISNKVNDDHFKIDIIKSLTLLYLITLCPAAIKKLTIEEVHVLIQ